MRKFVCCIVCSQAHEGVALLNALPLAQSGNSSEASKNENMKAKSKKPKPSSEDGNTMNADGECP